MNQESVNNRMSNVGVGSTMEALLPQYRCHKKVWALRIKRIESIDVMEKGKPQTSIPTGAKSLVFANESFLPRAVSADWVSKHNPVDGGYWVQYPDGYESFSPAKAFEDGYTLIEWEL